MADNYVLNTQYLADVRRDYYTKSSNSHFSNRTISSDINSFIDSSLILLRGSGWNSVRSNLKQTAEVLDYIDKMSDYIYEEQEEIITYLLNFLGDDENLEVNKLEEYNLEKRMILTQIKKLENERLLYSKVPQFIRSSITDEDGNISYTIKENEPAYSNAMGECKSITNKLNDELYPRLREVKRLIDKINYYFDVVLPHVNDLIDNLNNKINKFASAINMIDECNPVIFDRYVSYLLDDNSNSKFYFNNKGIPYAVYYYNSRIYIDYSKNSDGDYKRYDPKNNKFYDISIFDEENLSSTQYGASQMAFENNFYELINDKDIWNEMQKYYPVSSFKSTDEAMEFYERYFRNITETGCGYAAGANIIFKEYEGREKEFEKTFGFTMYDVDNEGNIDFNYELMQLKYFNYSWANKGYSIEAMERGTQIDSNLEQLFNKNSVTTAADLRNLDDFLATYDIEATSKLDIANRFSTTRSDDTVNRKLQSFTDDNEYVVYGGNNWDLYSEDAELLYKNGGGHFLMVTGYTNDGYPIVSSWGKKYILDINSEDSKIGVYRYNYVNINS